MIAQSAGNPSPPRIKHRPPFATLLWRRCGLNSTADEAVVDQAEDDSRDPAEHDAKDDAVDPNPNQCHRCDRKQANPPVCGPPIGQNHRDCQADHEQDDERCLEPPSYGNDVEGIIRRCPCVHRTLHLIAEKRLRFPMSPTITPIEYAQKMRRLVGGSHHDQRVSLSVTATPSFTRSLG